MTFWSMWSLWRSPLFARRAESRHPTSRACPGSVASSRRPQLSATPLLGTPAGRCGGTTSSCRCEGSVAGVAVTQFRQRGLDPPSVALHEARARVVVQRVLHRPRVAEVERLGDPGERCRYFVELPSPAMTERVRHSI